jgi:biotin carboxyl carrier protein
MVVMLLLLLCWVVSADVLAFRLTLESMKMEIKIVAPRAGHVHYFVSPKQAVHEGMVLFDIK